MITAVCCFTVKKEENKIIMAIKPKMIKNAFII
jgi:hypothetical protein